MLSPLALNSSLIRLQPWLPTIKGLPSRGAGCQAQPIVQLHVCMKLDQRNDSRLKSMWYAVLQWPFTCMSLLMCRKKIGIFGFPALQKPSEPRNAICIVQREQSSEPND